MAQLDTPFACPGNWYKANLHAHTTNSDGDLAPEAAAEFYRQAGYDILAITDHWCVTELASEHEGVLLVPGVEYNVGTSAQGTPYHIVGLDVRTRGKIPVRTEQSAQELIDAIRADGGEAFVAHPYWSGLMASDIAPLRDCLAVEVYNTGCDLEILRGFSMVHWDDLLTLGWSGGAVAVDDGHHHQRDHGRAWTMVRAPKLTVPAVMEALRRGRYYASIGPEILDLQVTEDTIRVRTSPVASISLVSVPGVGARRRAPAGGTLTEAEFPLPKAPYCRIEVTEAAGKSAWCNPFPGKRE